MEKQVFFNEVSATFTLREPKSIKPTNIYLCVYMNGKQYKFSTGLKVYPEHWNKSKYKSYVGCRITELDNINNTIVNERLLQLHSYFDEFKNYICNNPNEIEHSLILLKQYIYKDMEQVTTNKPIDVYSYLFNCLDNDVNKKGDILAVGKDRSTKATDAVKLRHFKSYIDANDLVFYYFNEITREVIFNYQQWLINNLDGRTGGKCSVKTINNIVTKLLELLNNYAVKRGKMDNTCFINLQIEKLRDKSASIDNHIALRDDEIYKLWNYKAKSKQDEYVKDVFILNCLVGQRIGDIDKLDKNIDQTDDSTYISLVQNKTTNKIEVDIVFSLAKTILEKYNYQLPNFNRQTFNKKIKVIAKDAGITGTETITTHSAGSNEPVTEYKDRSECISSHSARRTFVTLLSVRGWAYNTIAKYTGHTVEMVELYDKSKGNTKTLRLFKELQKNNPQLVLKLIDEYEQQDQQVNSDVSSKFESLYNELLSLHSKLDSLNSKQDDKTKPVIDKNNIYFDVLFCKRWSELSAQYQLLKLKGIKQTDKDEETYNKMIATIIKDAEREDATIKDAINNYKPKEQDYFKLRTLLSTWVELNINCNAIDLYLNRAKSVGIDTTGLKEYLDENEFIIK